MAMSGLTAKGPPAGLPKFLLYIRIVIIVLSLIILALAAYAISIFGNVTYYYGAYNGAAGLLIFTVIKTWLIYGIFTVIEWKAPHLFFRIIAIIAYAISVVFWLSAFAYAASWAAYWLSFFGDYYYRGDNPLKTEGAVLAACAGIGALIWILSIVHLVFLIKACLSDRSGGAHSQAELGHVAGGPGAKVEGSYPTTTPTPVQYGQPAPYGAPQQTPYGAPQQQAPAYGAQQAPYGAPQQQPYPTQ